MDTVRWGILGAANIAKSTLAPTFWKTPGCKLLAVASRNPEKARKFAQEVGADRSYGSYEELLADPDIDAVYVPVPTGEHRRWSIAAAEAGKHVLCEKPLAPTRADGEAMFATFRDKGRFLSEGLMARYHPLNTTALRYVKEGRIGRPYLASAVFTAHSIEPTDFRRQPNLGGGALLDLGVYCVNVLRQLLGEPLRVSAHALWGEGDVDLSTSAVLTFPDGVLGTLQCTLETPFSCSYTVIGTEGQLTVPWGAMVAWPGDTFHIVIRDGKGETREAIPPADHYQMLVEDFLGAIRENRPMQFGPADTLANLDVIDRIRASANQNR